jgi:8-oxo-dGTP pyrophosphatase MutT (NUDIX family)
MKIVGCFLEYEGKFVILLRHSHKPNGDTWGLPAGKVESGEEDKFAALRELKEETGYISQESELEYLGNYNFGQGDSNYTFVTYRIPLVKPYEIIVEDSAHAKYRWVTAKECYALPNLIPDFHELLKLVGFVK